MSALEWGEFMEMFRDKYFPPSVREQLEVEFLGVVQDRMTVREYEARFSQLYRFVAPMSEEHRARKFERDLKHKLRSVVTPYRHPTVALMVACAIASEQEHLAYSREQAMRNS